MKLPTGLRQWVMMIVASLIFCVAAESASAQTSRAGSMGGGRSSGGGGASRNRNLPSRRNKPTVSPYLSLINSAGNGTNMFNFYNIVRPQRRAQRAAAALNSELRFVEGNLNSLRRSNAAGNQSTSTLQEDTAPSFSGRMEPTGHPTAFGDLKGFYADYGDQR